MTLQMRHIAAVLGTVQVTVAVAMLVAGVLAGYDMPVRHWGIVAAHSIAGVCCVLTALDYPAHSLFRRSWFFFCGEALFMGSRAGIMLLLGYSGPPVSSWWSPALITAGSCCMAAGAVTAVLGFRSAGLAARLLRRDYAFMGALFVLLTLALVSRFGWPPVLGWSAGPPIAISITAVIAVPLLRYSRQMESAILARTYAGILAYMTVRCIYQFIGVPPVPPTAAGFLSFVIGHGAAWVFAYAAALRYDATRRAARQLEALHRTRAAA